MQAIQFWGNPVENPRRFDLVWHCNVSEAKWIRFLLTRTNGFREVPCNDWAPVPEIPSLHVLSTNDKKATSAACRLFKQLHEDGHPFAIFHLSDEWVREDTTFYQGARFCLRNHWCSFIKNDDIFYIPIGYPNKWIHEPSLNVPASRRKHLCFFNGQVKTSRFQMLKAFKNFDGFYCPTHLPPLEEYIATLGQTVYSFCPMGNATPDTFRLYESLEAGAIPVIEHRLTVDFFKELLGPHPIPSFGSWYAAKSWIKGHRSPSFLDVKQLELKQWWEAKKIDLQNKISDVVRTKFATGYESCLKNYRPRYTGFALQVRWRIELLRYLNLGAIPYRIRKLTGAKTFMKHPRN